MKAQKIIVAILAVLSVAQFACQKHDFQNPLDPEASISAPSNVVVAAITATSAALQWQDNSGNETSFEIEQSTDGIAFSLAASAPANASGAVVAGIFAPNTVYTFRVRAKNQNTNSGYSATARGSLFQAPTSPFPSANATGTASSLTLTWTCTDPANSPLSYDVFFGTTNPPLSAIATNLNTPSLTVPALTELTTYYWQVVAKNSRNETVKGPVWSFTTISPSTLPGMVAVQGGAFTAGSTFIAITSFKIDKFEVTYDLWTEVRAWALTHGYTDLPAGNNGRNPVGAANPVANINWYDAVKWCNARSEKSGLTPTYYTSSAFTTVYRTGSIDINTSSVDWNANGFRLPTEAEWEYAARGGTQSVGYLYSGGNTGTSVAWFDNNSNSSTHAVGTKNANELGIFDMSGNIEEWCWDWHAASYPSGGLSDPRGPSVTETHRIVRGGSYNSYESETAVNVRFYKKPDLDFSYVMDGLRCVQR